MNADWKDFEGKSIDEAIEAACKHFDAEREQLEIEIVSDSKSGIFGLVGNKNAKVKARLRDSFAEVQGLIQQIVKRLVDPIVGDCNMSVEMDDADRVRVVIEDDEHSGLLIGREGQTLSSLQYLANRIAARRLENAPHLQIDVGDYRERQDDNLRQLALDLAEKVKSGGKPQSTRPLSSYHRRVVHMALKNDEDVLTRSKGDGPQKRVLILAKRGKGGGRGNRRDSQQDDSE